MPMGDPSASTTGVPQPVTGGVLHRAQKAA